MLIFIFIHCFLLPCLNLVLLLFFGIIFCICTGYSCLLFCYYELMLLLRDYLDLFCDHFNLLLQVRRLSLEPCRHLSK